MGSEFGNYRIGIDVGREGDEVVIFGPVEDSLEGMRPLRWSAKWGDGVFMGSLPESTQRRLDALVDKDVFRNDMYYRTVVTQFQSWLVQANYAMQDEEVDPDVIVRVLNRMVYGHPSGAEAHERRDLMRRQQEMLEKMPLNTGVLMELLGEKKTPREWEQQSSDITRIVVDPDGWRGIVEGYPFSRDFCDAITLVEYQARAMASTVRPKDQKEHVAH